MTVNYELVYKVRKGGYVTDSLSNLEVRARNKAMAEAVAVHQRFVDFLKRELGTDQFEVTNVACMADGVIGHVYVGGAKRGYGRRTCCFCGCDDFDD